MPIKEGAVARELKAKARGSRGEDPGGLEWDTQENATSSTVSSHPLSDNRTKKHGGRS